MNEDCPSLESDFKPSYFGAIPYDKEERQKVAQLLSEPLTRDDVQTRPGPSRLPLTYISGFKAIDKANRVFGFDGWTSQIMGFDMNYNKETQQGKHICCFTVRLRITLKNGAFREDVGVGFAESHREAEAIEKSQKEAVTDAYKRTLKNFGVALGLCLYDNEHIKALNSLEDSTTKENITCLEQPRNFTYSRKTSNCVPNEYIDVRRDRPLFNESAENCSKYKGLEDFLCFQRNQERSKQLEESLSGLKPSDFEDVEHIL
ncbi:DNA repair and recombination protein rti1 [Galdieria sulphuraria]|nr:DNA repair and recombination protein rti1 [Galdieria sulphuraria]